MSVVFTLLIFSVIGSLRARQPDIDINRIKLLPKEGSHIGESNYHSRRSILSDHNKRNDYDYYSSRFSKLRPPLHVRHDTPSLTQEKTGKVYQPREDPRLFYQSDAYIKETNRKNLNNEVSSIYIGRGVVRAGEQHRRRSLPIRMRDNEFNSIHEGICVRCPPDRTLITKPGVDRATLQYPRILSCSGRKAPRHVRFVHMYGPKFGSLLKEGSHMVVGRITHKDEILQICKMQIHVLVQSCSVPKYLVPHCGAENKACNFTCRDPKAELRGQRTLTCGDDMSWSGHLPVCSEITMGSNTSKANNTEAPAQTAATIKNDLDVSDICNNSDPRSPTPEISRTPLQNKSTGKHNITKNVDLRKTFENGNGEEKLIHNNPILSAVIKNHLQSYDPRSPTLDFERTPIIISTKTDEAANEKKLLRLQSDNCASPVLNAETDDNCDSCAEACEKSPDLVVSRNLCEGFFNITLDDTLKESEEPLGSSTASHAALENISSESQNKQKFLETNFEYVENEDKFEDSEENMNCLEDTDTINEDEDDGPVFQVLDDDPRSPSIGIERTPIVVAKTEEDSNVETMSDDTLIKVLQSTNAELRQTGAKTDNNVDGLLIYEDEATDLNDTPKKSKSASNSGSRTPLSCMKNKGDVGHARSKSVNTLYDPKNQKVGTKIPKRVSHIPRLKCLSKQPNLIPAESSVSLKNISKATTLGGDCENTPPHSHRDRWDKDSSIVL